MPCDNHNGQHFVVKDNNNYGSHRSIQVLAESSPHTNQYKMACQNIGEFHEVETERINFYDRGHPEIEELLKEWNSSAELPDKQSCPCGLQSTS